MNPIYTAAALAVFGWLLKYLVDSIRTALAELKEAIGENTKALTSFQAEAHETFLRKDDYRVRLMEGAYGRRRDDETLPGTHVDKAV